MTSPPFALDSATYLWNSALGAEDGSVVPTDLLATIETLIPLLRWEDRAVADDLRVLSDRLDLSLHGGLGDPTSTTQSIAQEVRKVLARLRGR